MNTTQRAVSSLSDYQTIWPLDLNRCSDVQCKDKQQQQLWLVIGQEQQTAHSVHVSPQHPYLFHTANNDLESSPDSATIEPFPSWHDDFDFTVDSIINDDFEVDLTPQEVAPSSSAYTPIQPALQSPSSPADQITTCINSEDPFNSNDPSIVRLAKRRQQNRVSQRSYRARKEARLQEAAAEIETLRAQVETLAVHNSDLKRINEELERQVFLARGIY